MDSSLVPRMVVFAAASRGIQPQELYERAGTCANELMPGVRVSYEVEVRLVEAACELAKDPDFGLAVGQLFDPDAFNVLSYIFFHSPTLRDGLQRTPRYQKLFTMAGGSELLEDDHLGYVRLWNQVLRPIIPRQNAEWSLSAFWKMVRIYCGDSIRLAGVHFKHRAPSSTATHLKVFGVEPSFECEHNQLLIHQADLDRGSALQESAPATYKAMVEQAESQLRELSPPINERSAYVRRVLLSLADELRGGQPKAKQIARRLATSERTLQRQLNESGTSFRELLDHLRSSFAVSYLHDSDLGIEEIAYLLGFASREAFHRAFQRWHKMAPAAFREKRS